MAKGGEQESLEYGAGGEVEKEWGEEGRGLGGEEV